VSSFIGRERELADLEALLGVARLVTITGAGGSGKTRLALELVARVRDERPDEAIFIDLVPIRNADLVVSTIAAAVGVRGEPQRLLIDTLVDRLAERRFLLILDNLEQLPDAGPIIAQLLSRCSNLRVLATSRSRLHLRGEHEYPVDPLSLPEAADLASPERLGRTEAVALFVERASSVNPHFGLTIENGASIAEICHRLDGLPLAIELATAWTKVLAPDALLRRIEHSLSVLSEGALDAPARQRTLRSTIAWSYDLLERADQIVFARLSVFAGGVSMPAAMAVVPDPADPPGPDLLRTLGRLVDQNLVRVAPGADGEPRFGFLETIRAFALDQLGAEESERLHGRHAAYFADLAGMARAELGGRDHAAWLARATAELDNFRGALEWVRARGDAALLLGLASAVSRFFIERGDHREAGRWLHAAEALAADAEPASRAWLLYELGEYEIGYEGDRERVEQLFSEALRLYESLGEPAGMARSVLYLAAVAADLGDPVKAEARLERARSLTMAVADRVQAARLMAALALETPVILERPELTLAREAVAIGVEIADRPTIAMGWAGIGMHALATGEALAAFASFSEAIQAWDELGDWAMRPWGLACLGIARVRADELEGARPILREAAAGSGVAPRYVGIWALEAIADWLGASERAEQATICWSAVDAAKAASLDRTFPMAPEFFTSSRERDRSALPAATYQAARASGHAMTLPGALAFAIRALDDVPDPSEDRPIAPGQRGRHDLTPREHEVLQLLAAGRSDGEIAEALYISKKTAAVHVANIKGKLEARSRIDIVRKASRRGLVELDDSDAG
jgi:predicted ATPase/DNA-binding CsgD family transcriptional regulator